ncbi:MAG: tetratricopeptide repeat protein [Pseudonocardiaceae bacterium]
MTVHPRPGEPAGEQINISRDHSVQYNVQHGTLNVHPRELAYRLEPLRPPLPVTSAVVGRQPSRLLSARYQVVDFTGRSEELSQLAGWRDDPELGVAVRLMHGPGGQGKTRLGTRFAELSRGLGWAVAEAVYRGHHASPPEVAPASVGGARGLVLLVDYAERWPLDDLLTLAGDPLLHTGLPARVLLLARPTGGWWESLAHRLGNHDMATDSLLLPPLADTAVARATVFTAARDRFAELLRVGSPGQIPPPARIGDEAFGLVLTVHMAALAAVDAHARGDTPPVDPAALSAYLLHRERDHWQHLYDNDHRIHTPASTMARAVFTAILTRPLSHPAGVTALTQVGITDPGQVLDDHRLCYPTADPATVCEPLYPDRLAEDFVALTTPGHTLAGYQPDPWADTAVTQLLAPIIHTADDVRFPVYSPGAVTVLIETARRWPHLAHRQLYPLLRGRPQLALAAGAAAVARLVELPHIDISVLEAIESHLPQGRHVDLDLAAAAVSTRLTQHRLAATTDPAQRARLCAIHGYRLANAGQREQALAATTEAVEVYRRLAGVNPAAFEPDLASALNNLGMMLSNLGRREEALAATTEAVEIRRRLAGVNPAAFEPHLARGLWSFAWVRAAGQVELPQALAAAEESVGIYEALYRRLPQAFAGDLRGALTTAADVLDGLGRIEDATKVRNRIEDLH